MLRLTLATSVLCALLGADLFAQRDCAPPSFRGPDGPRGSDPSTPTTPSTPSTGTPRTTPTGDGRTSTPRDGRTPRTGGPRGGMVLTVTRGKSSRKRLNVDWKYPKPRGENQLDYESVLKELRSGDPRPMLILREGSDYGKGYDRKLQAILSNEKTALMTRWFRCVRFSTEIMDERHPYHALFSGKYPPHAYVVSWDGMTSVPVSGAFSINEVQRCMNKVLKVEYRKDPNKAVREWFRLLSRYDQLDHEERQIKKQRDAVEIERGIKSAKFKKLSGKLAKIAKQRIRFERSERNILNLGLIRKHNAKAQSALLDQLRGTR